MVEKLSDLQALTNKKQPKKLVLAAAHDLHALEAVVSAAKKGIIEAILVGEKKIIQSLAKEHLFDISGLKIIDVGNPIKAVETAVKMVHQKEADVLMKGNIGTATLLKGVLNKEWGLRKGALLSHFALFEIPAYHKLLALTDVAMNIAPEFKDKLSILNNAVEFMNKIGYINPKVAVIGAVEVVNDAMSATIDAALLSKMFQRGQIKNCIVDGPLAFDNAIDKESAKNKGIESNVAGDADLLLMPNIEAGNVLYKAFSFFAGGSVASVILGATAPIVLTSRSDTEESKQNSIMLAAASES
ncbi:bifunctional enoyl-CoA hydratase/phosphate acetyltransferase [candidate division KSB1 bacterium]